MEPVSPLASWENFYVIVGSSAGALTGLQFVVVVLATEANMLSGGTNRAFGTPTVMHFCAALLVSAILSAPWPALSSAGLALGACGVAGVAYALVVVRRARQQTGYVPVLEDWIWHAVLPFGAYAALAIAGARLGSSPASSLFVIAGAALLLLFVGIHNSWDAVTYIALARRDGGVTERTTE